MRRRMHTNWSVPALPMMHSEGRARKARLAAWLGLLDREKLMEYVVASYEAAPLLAEYSPRINAHN